jgi:hypothetical protein
MARFKGVSQFWPFFAGFPLKSVILSRLHMLMNQKYPGPTGYNLRGLWSSGCPRK